jgi:cell division protein ZapA
MTEKNKVSLKIAGKEYTIVGSEPEEYIHKIGNYIDKKLSDIMRTSVKLNNNMAAVLTAINVADDFFKAREAENYFKDELLKLKRQVEDLRKENESHKGDLQSLKLQNKELHKAIAKREAELGEGKNLYKK